MREDSQLPLYALKVDGGTSNNSPLLQFQSDILNIPVCKGKVSETTSLSAS